MILCFTSDDPDIVDDAYRGYAQEIFGTPYCYLKDHLYGMFLGRTENLFISAHGNEDEIGNQEGRPSFTPAALAKLLETNVFPGIYAGSIYVSACGSAPQYVNGLLAALGKGFNGRVFGMFGDTDYIIDPPMNKQWILAT